MTCGECSYFRHCKARGKRADDHLCYEEPTAFRPIREEEHV
jgi:hypothetical protein